MALTKEVINDKIEVVQTGNGYPVVQVRTATIIKENDEVISRTYHRKVVAPDADLTVEDADVKKIASAVFTTSVKNKYAEYIASLTPTIQASEVI